MQVTLWGLSVHGRAAATALALLLTGVAGAVCAQVPAQAPASVPAQVTAFTQAVAEAASDDAEIAAFYRAAGYAPVWTGSGAVYRDRLAALSRAVSDAPAHGLPADRYSPEIIEGIVRSIGTERDRGRAEVDLSRLFLSYARDIQTGILTPARIDPEILREVPRRSREGLLRAFSLSAPGAFLRSLPPSSPQYAQLMKGRMDFERLVAAGGWGDQVRTNRTLRPGDTGGDVIALRNRLIRMGYLPRTATAGYDAGLERAVLAFQADHGLTPDGVAGPGTVDEINVQAETRLRQIFVAMERERWLNHPDGRGARHIWVNLTDFSTKVYDDGKVTFETRSVIGERINDKQTPEFSDEMEYMELNPDWTVPRSIIARDYLPRFQQNPNAAQYLQLIDSRGRVVSRDQIDFTQYTARTFPYTVRQPPGDLNALGLVKFMFPNPEAIYLHDTPAKNLFSREVRAYSSGCIRLNDPFELAYHLLARQEANPRDVFDSTLRTGRQTRIDFETHIPVHLVYFTAYPGPRGEIEFRRDVYGRDARIWSALQNAGVAFGAVRG